MTRSIPTLSGDEVLVDDEDYDLVSGVRWRSSPIGSTTYAAHGPPTVYMHRMIMRAGPGEIVDHIDMNGLNNQRANLRLCTKSQNQCNKPKYRNNTSGFKGVSYAAGRNKCWNATIKYQGKRRNLGYFFTKEEAFEAYKKAALELHGEFARFE